MVSENHDFKKCNSVFKEMLEYNLDKNESFFTLWNAWVEFPEGRLFQKKLHTYIENNAFNCKYLFISDMLSSCQSSDLLNGDSQLMKNSFKKKSLEGYQI